MSDQDDEEQQLDEPFADDGAVLRARVTQLESMFADTRSELIGVLNSGVKYGRSVKENVLFISEQQSGIQNAIKMMFKPKMPWNMILVMVIAVSLTGMFVLRPEYGKELGLWLSLQQNQFFAVVIAIVFVIVMFILARRRRKQA